MSYHTKTKWPWALEYSLIVTGFYSIFNEYVAAPMHNPTLSQIILVFTIMFFGLIAIQLKDGGLDAMKAAEKRLIPLKNETR